MNGNTTARRSAVEGSATIMQRAWALVLALALCLGFMPHAAWAQEEGASGAQAAQAVTLTIVQGIGYDGPNALVNKTYSFEDGATVADLFEAAKAAGDIKDYAFADAFGTGSEFLSSVTLADGTVVAGASGWWGSCVDGVFDDGSGTAAASPLAAGTAVQFAWCDSVPNIAPSAEQWKALAGAATPGKSMAGDASKPEAGSATLAIVQGVGYEGPVALVNKTYKFAKDATVADLFEAAKAAGDIKDYAFADAFGTGSEFLSSVTLADGTVVAGASGWWGSYVDGVMDDGSGTAAASPLKAGTAVQFAWCDSVPNIAPTAEQWQALKSAATPGEGSAEGAEPLKPSPSASAVDTATLDSSLNAVYRGLFDSLSATLAGSGGASERNVSSWMAMEAAAIGQASVADADAAVADAVSAYQAPDGFNVQRSIIVLTSLGIDATKVPANGGTIDLVARIADDADAVSAYPTSSAFTLLAYACGPYEVKADAVNAPRALIDKLAAAQSAAGGYLAMGSVDVDTTAMVIPALAAYQGDAVAKAALDKAVAALRGTQKEDGSFGNVNSTSVAIIAFAAVGIDPADEAAWGAATPLRALLSSAKEDLSGFAVATGMQEDMVNEQGFRALVAYQGLKNTGVAYNVYTQAKLGQAALPAEKQQETNEDENVAAKTVGVSKKEALAKTGDGSAPLAAGVAALALGALASGAIATRRMRAAREYSQRR